MPIVKRTLDLKKPSKLSKEALKRFDAIKEEDINYSDIPEITDEMLGKKNKSRVHARFDTDMVEWFKSHGEGYQTRMNAVLRAFYEQHQLK
ncbi:MAG: BrnA antitoxin family protein [Rhizobiales bacterium]|nr:BrnA antitoxin family protein [Hyphomicrobiales bacterium]